MARFLSTVNSESERLGEIPTRITCTPQWPYGRYTEPAGGRFIREYGQTGPLPKALTELRLAEIESPPARAYLDGAYVEKSPELSPHEWGETTRPMGDVEREYLAALGGRPRYGRPLSEAERAQAHALRYPGTPLPPRGTGVGRLATVESQITGVNVPDSVSPDAGFIIKVFITTVGTGCDKQFIVFFDPIVGDHIGGGKSDECLPPGITGTWTATFNPLNDWYPATIPSTLNWTARVGYVTAEYPDGSFDGIVTDERQLPDIPVTEAPPPPPPPPWWDKYKYYLIAGSAVAAVGVAVVATRK
ncbi:hypothetical protein ES703_00027 [subsurface metagenome]